MRHTDMLQRHQNKLSADPFDDIDGLYRQEFSSSRTLLVPPNWPKSEPRTFRVNLIASCTIIDRQHVERHLSQLRLLRARYFDCSVGCRRIGWTITTPLCLLQAQLPHQTRGVTIAKRIESYHVAEPSGEFARVATRIAAWTRSTISKNCLPELRKISPWIEKSINVHDGAVGSSR